MTGSYIRNCSIHDSFNRGINVDSSGCLNISNNVLFSIKGSGVNLESGNEVDNLIKHNLVISAIASDHLQTEDRAPAAFWISNPQNTLEHNIASGGTHIGFWYKLGSTSILDMSLGNSFQPYHSSLTLFEHNEAHSNVMYGFLMDPIYYPIYNNRLSHFKSWNNQIGIQIKAEGAVYLSDMYLVNNELNNIVLTDVSGSPVNTAMFYNSLLVAVDFDLDKRSNSFMTIGLLLPTEEDYNINNITFIGYNGSKAAIARTQSTSCKLFKYGTSNLTFLDSPSKIRLNPEDLFLVKDIDGSLCGTPNRNIVPSSGILSNDCRAFTNTIGNVSHCASDIHLLLLNHHLEIALLQKQVYIDPPCIDKCTPEYTTRIENKNHYQLKLLGNTLFTNESYTGNIHDMKVFL